MMASAETLESRLFRSYWDDGLLDVLAGAGILGVSACWAMDLVAVGAAVPAVLAPFWVLLRRSLVEPRVGLVEFSDARTDRMRRLGRGSVGLGVGTLTAVVAAYLIDRPTNGLLTNLAPAIPAGLLGLMTIIVGWGLGLPRFLGYAGVLGLAGLGVAVADAQPELAMLVGGAAMLGSGTWRLSRFLRLPVEREGD